MKKPRIPSDWRHMIPGSMVSSRLPYHRITAAIAELEREGYRFSTAPSDSGYFVTCDVNPNDKPKTQ